MWRKLLLAAIVLFGVAYLLSMQGDIMPLKFVLKPGTIVLMIVWVATARGGTNTYRNWIMAGLALSAVGDAFLLMKDDRWFVYGVFSFLLAHVLYIAAFATRLKFGKLHALAVVPIAVYSFLLLRAIHGGMFGEEGSGGGMWIPVVVYVVVISLMAFSAVMTRSGTAIIGAVLFIISDSLLAWNKFVAPFEWAGYAVMITYYLAQGLIAASVFTRK